MSAESVFFSRSVDDRYEVIGVEPDASEQASTFPAVVVLRLSLTGSALAANGFPNRGAAETMDGFQAALQDHFCRAKRWPWSRGPMLWPLSRRTRAERRGLAIREIAYAARPGVTPATVSAWLARQKIGGFGIEVVDGDWDAHYHALVPSRLELHMSALVRRLRGIAAEGADLILPHRRTHWLSAGAGADIKTAANALRAQGFLTVEPQADGIRFSTIEPLTPDAIRPVDETILGICDTNGLGYEGFTLDYGPEHADTRRVA